MSTDSNLLAGILAVQMNFISRDGLIEAMNAWVLQKQRPLLELLPLQDSSQQLLKALIEEHLRLHDHDTQKSLAALSTVTSVHALLRHRVPDADVQTSLGNVVASTMPMSPYRTQDATLRYRILRPHARGGLGEIYVAEDSELRREVALKEIQERHAGNPESRSRFLLEAEVTGGLEHPNIVPVYGLGTYDDGRPYYAMRFIRGDSLKEAIERYSRTNFPTDTERNLAFRNLLKRFVDVCNAMAYAHSRRILHRDLKPGNVMLGKYGETLVVDWGLAKSMARSEPKAEQNSERPLVPTAESHGETQHGRAIGTPAFMSPEQADGRLDELGPATDIYSLGATLYVILTGKPAFEGDVVEILQKIQEGDFPAPQAVNPKVPAALSAIALRAMSKRPGDRYATATALAVDVEHYLAEEPVAAYREPFRARARRWARKHPSLVAGLSVAVIVGALLASLQWWRVNQERKNTQDERDKTAQALRTVTETKDQLLQQKGHTLQALNAMTDDVIEHLFAKANKLTEAQKQFLQKVVALYDQAGADLSDSADSRILRAQGRHRVAGVLRTLGDLKAAERNYLEALSLRESLANEEPGILAYRFDLAESHNTYGALLRDNGRNAAAETHFRKAIVLQSRLADERPDVPDYRRHLALSLGNLAILYTSGRIELADAEYRKSKDLLKALVRDFPDRAAYRSDLGKNYCDHGVMHYMKRDLKLAEAEYRAACDLQRQLVKDYPEEAEYRSELIGTYANLGIVLNARGATAEVEQIYQEGRDLAWSLVTEYPSVTAYRYDLVTVLSNLAIRRRMTSQPAEAKRVLLEALPHFRVSLKAEPDHQGCLQAWRACISLLTELLIESKDYVALADVVDDLARYSPIPKEGHFEAACLLGQCWTMVKADTTLKEPKRTELQKRYSDHAIEHLRSAVKLGYKSLNTLRTHEDLAPFRDREEFQKLLVEVEKNRAVKPVPK